LDVGIVCGLNPGNQLLEYEAGWRGENAPEGIDPATLEPEGGLAGWVSITHEPSWVEDIASTAEFPWGAVAARKGVHGGLMFPVIIGEQVFAVLAFFSRQIQPVDDELLKATALIASQIGQFVERRRAEEAFELSEARFARFMQH